MTFNEWHHQSYIPFDDWFIQEWDNGNLQIKNDNDVKKFLVEFVQEEQVRVVEKTEMQKLIESIFKIKNRYFRIVWSTPCEHARKIDEFFHLSPIAEVQKIEKNISFDIYVSI